MDREQDPVLLEEEAVAAAAATVVETSAVAAVDDEMQKRAEGVEEEPPAQLKPTAATSSAATSSLVPAAAADASSHSNSGEAASVTPISTDVSEAVQIVDGDGEICKSFHQAMEQWAILRRGFEYNVVSILGAQSSGKSTLLNGVFGTTFAVMDETAGRGQTTKGIWVGKSTESATLIFDVEGTDGRERGEDKNFERKSSLFSLAMSQVLMINMLENDVGRYNAANYSIIKTILEMNLRLFVSAGKDPARKLLMFVLRDRASNTPLDSLSRIIVEDLHKIWADIHKPSQWQHSAVDDFFDVAFVTLAHKILTPQKFTDDVAQLRKRFNESDQPDYVWKAGDNYRPEVPVDGFMTYAENIWAIIKSNKDLDLPTQKELLSQFRCEEIATNILRDASQKLAELHAQVSDPNIAAVSTLGASFTDLLSTVVADYDLPAANYSSVVAAQRRALLLSTLEKEMQTVYTSQLRKLRKEALCSFERQFVAAVPEDSRSVVENFSKLTDAAVHSALDQFQSGEQSSLPDLAGLPAVSGFAEKWAEVALAELEDLRVAVLSRVSVARKAQIRLLSASIQREFVAEKLEPDLVNSYENVDDETWREIRESYSSCSKAALQRATTLLQGFDIEEAEKAAVLHEIEESLLACVMKTARENADNILQVMQRRFHKLFSNDESGRPRVWDADDDVPALFDLAREEAIKVIDVLAVVRLDPKYDQVTISDETSLQDVPEDLILLRLRDCKRAQNSFNDTAGLAYKAAMREREANTSRQHVPVLMVVLCCVLGFNEAIAVLQNPLLLLLILLCGAVAFFAHHTGLTRFLPDTGTLVSQLASLIRHGLTMLSAMADDKSATSPPPPSPSASSSARHPAAAAAASNKPKTE